MGLRRPGAIRLVSCYESGHQPLAVASAAAFLERAGYRPRSTDLAVQPLEHLLDDEPGSIRLVAVSVPMHTALHVGLRAARRIRERLPDAHLCFYGHYALLNAAHLLDGPADSVIGGEFETPLVGLADALAAGGAGEGLPGVRTRGGASAAFLARQDFPRPSRDGLPDPARYARLEIQGESRPAAAVEASRGCLHRCRHCPIPPVYGGRFFVVPRQVVLDDVRALVSRGVRHVTFADPDFFNGPRHGMAIVREMHERFPGLTFDVTTKIENVLGHRDRFDELARCGCVFVVSAVESLSDRVLEQLDKGHTRADVIAALRIVEDAGLALRPSLVPFTPWATLEDYGELLDWIEGDGLTRHVDPVQMSIRLLVPPGSPLADSAAMRPHLRGLDPARFGHRWEHPDPAMDRLQIEVAAIVARAARAGEAAEATYATIRSAARALDPASPATTRHLPARAVAPPPRLTEPWFC